MKSDLNNEEDGCLFRIKQNKKCVAITGLVILVGFITLITLHTGKVPPAPAPEPDPSRTIIVSADTMIAIYSASPVFSLYNENGSGLKFKADHWDNGLYGGTILNPVKSCSSPPETCSKPNNLTYEMKDIKADEKYHGYYELINLPTDKDDTFVDIKFFTHVTTEKDYNLLESFNASTSFKKE